MADFLALDIGNTDIKLGVFHHDTLVQTERIPSNRQHLEQVQAQLTEILAAIGPELSCAFCSVVPALDVVVRNVLKNHCKAPPLQVLPAEIRLPFDAGDYPLTQIGADRVVNLAAAQALFPGQPVIVADFGTATTFDVLTASGRYLGGAIAPGYKTFAGILSTKTACLPQVLPQPAPSVLGHNTIECLQVGITAGYVGLVKEILTQMRVECGFHSLPCIATGGLAESVAALDAESPLFDKLAPTLTLQGLHILYQQSLQAQK